MTYQQYPSLILTMCPVYQHHTVPNYWVQPNNLLSQNPQPPISVGTRDECPHSSQRNNRESRPTRRQSSTDRRLFTSLETAEYLTATGTWVRVLVKVLYLNAVCFCVCCWGFLWFLCKWIPSWINFVNNAHLHEKLIFLLILHVIVNSNNLRIIYTLDNFILGKIVLPTKLR